MQQLINFAKQNKIKVLPTNILLIGDIIEPRRIDSNKYLFNDSLRNIKFEVDLETKQLSTDVKFTVVYAIYIGLTKEYYIVKHQAVRIDNNICYVTNLHNALETNKHIASFLCLDVLTDTIVNEVRLHISHATYNNNFYLLCCNKLIKIENKFTTYKLWNDYNLYRDYSYLGDVLLLTGFDEYYDFIYNIVTQEFQQLPFNLYNIYKQKLFVIRLDFATHALLNPFTYAVYIQTNNDYVFAYKLLFDVLL